MVSVGRDGPSKHLLGSSFVVRIGGIDEVDSRIPGGGDDALGYRLIAGSPEHHCPKTNWGYFQSASSKFSIFHFNLLRPFAAIFDGVLDPERWGDRMGDCCFKRTSHLAIEHIADAKLNRIHDVLTIARVFIRPRRAKYNRSRPLQAITKVPC
jgi:hypothetical protein